MAKIVVDSSIILACLLNEPEKRSIEEITSGAHLIAPASLPWEI